MERTILDLARLASGLPPAERAIWERIFRVRESSGGLVVPPSMQGWARRQFGSVEAVADQRVVHVLNTVVWEGALFNPLRARRPVDAPPGAAVEEAAEGRRGDPFCSPLELTPEDAFGRVRGRHCVSASNVAKYDGFHGVVVFDEHDPLRLTAERVADYIGCGLAWAERCREQDPEARNVVLLWNCLWRAGASIVHGHAQVVCSSGLHYGRVEHLREAASRYRDRHGSDYLADLARLHEALGLGLRWRGVRALASLTPVKEREVILLADGVTDELKEAAWRALDALVGGMGVRSFNLALVPPPAGDPRWEGFPALVRIVDRGDPMCRSSDIGAMELWGSSVVSTDPFEVARALLGSFRRTIS